MLKDLIHTKVRTDAESARGIAMHNPHSEVDNSEARISAARDLIHRGAPFSPEESALLGECWPDVKLRPIADGIDVVLAATSQRFHRIWLKPTPRIATPFDEAIAEARAPLAEMTEAYDKATDAFVNATIALRRAEMLRGDPNVPSFVNKLKEAEEDQRVAGQNLQRARCRVTALEASASRWRAEQTSYVMGRNGQPVKLADFKA